MKKSTIVRSTAAALASVGMFAFASSASAVPTNLIDNPGFEVPASATQNYTGGMVPDASFPGWQTTDDQGMFEVWDHATPGPGDSQYIELNAYSAGAVYQDIATTACDILTFSVQHRARMTGTDVMHVLAGAAGGTGDAGLTALEASTFDGAPLATKTTEISDEIGSEGDDTAWHTWTGTYQVPAGQTNTRIAFAAVSSSSGDVTAGNFLDNVSITAETATCPAPKKKLATTGTDSAQLELAGSLALVGGFAAMAIAGRRKNENA